jgi:hypothetical protein
VWQTGGKQAANKKIRSTLSGTNMPGLYKSRGQITYRQQIIIIIL